MRRSPKSLGQIVLWGMILTLTACSTVSDKPRTPAASRPADEATIRELMQVTGAAEIGQQFLDAFLVPMKDALPQVPETLWAELRARPSVEELVGLIVPIYQKHLTQAEAETLVAFWSSPVGQRFVEKQPKILQESMAAGQQWGEALAKEVLEALQEEGYELSASKDSENSSGGETTSSTPVVRAENSTPAPGGYRRR